MIRLFCYGFWVVCCLPQLLQAQDVPYIETTVVSTATVVSIDTSLPTSQVPSLQPGQYGYNGRMKEEENARDDRKTTTTTTSISNTGTTISGASSSSSRVRFTSSTTSTIRSSFSSTRTPIPSTSLPSSRALSASSNTAPASYFALLPYTSSIGTTNIATQSPKSSTSLSSSEARSTTATIVSSSRSAVSSETSTPVDLAPTGYNNQSQPAQLTQINSTQPLPASTSPANESKPSESTQAIYSILPYIPTNVSSIANPSSSRPPVPEFYSGSAPTAPVVYATSYPSSAILHPPKPFYSNFTWPNATNPSNSSYTPLNDTCSLSNPTCPACDNKTVTDLHNVTYTVHCGYSLDATLDFALAEPLTAEYCLSRCDERNVTCLGASWSTEECVLALGPILGRIEDPNHLAFLRLGVPQPQNVTHPTTYSPRPAVATGPSYSNMTNYGGRSLTRVTRSTSSTTDTSIDTYSSSTTAIESDSAASTSTLVSDVFTTASIALATAANPFATVESYTDGTASASGRPPWAGPPYGNHGPPRPSGPPSDVEEEGEWPWWLQWGWWKKAWGGHGPGHEVEGGR